MSESHVVSALIRKRAELAGQIEGTQIRLRQFIIDLDNLDATLRLFAPDIDLEDIRRACPACDGSNRTLVVTPSKGTFYCFSAKKGGECISLVAHICDLGIRRESARP